MNRGVVGKLIARKSVSPEFEPWHWLVQVINSVFGDAVCDIFLKKGIVFTKVYEGRRPESNADLMVIRASLSPLRYCA